MSQLISEFIQELGFSEEAGALYASLAIKGPLTILETSRASGIERTAIYRIVDDLTARGLIEEVLGHKVKRLQAVSPQRIKDLLDKERQRVEKLEREYTGFEKLIQSLPPNHSTQVRYFRGVAGIKQILWNESKAKSEVVGYTYRNLVEVVGKVFFEDYARELEKNKVKMRDLRADAFMESAKSEGFVKRHIEDSGWRYLPDATMKLTHNLDVYDDVVVMYYWDDNDVWGVEIQNARMAEMQRSIFETLWRIAKKVKLESR